jgi:phosphoserine phosphatase
VQSGDDDPSAGTQVLLSTQGASDGRRSVPASGAATPAHVGGQLPREETGYGWPPVIAEHQGLPLYLVDLDGTLRGDVLPMVRLAQPLIPKVLLKIKGKAPVHLAKAVQFVSSVGELWVRRAAQSEQRRRYKYFFSELHHLAAAMLQHLSQDAVRNLYSRRIPGMEGLWHSDAIALLRRLTRDAIVSVVTGSEQIQTEECVRLLSPLGVDISRVYVRGSLYGYDAKQSKFTGKVSHLNVSLDGKRDAVRDVTGDGKQPVVGAIGNSRPDRALFEVARPEALCALVCPKRVIKRRKQGTFALRKIEKHGFKITWNLRSYQAAWWAFGAKRAPDRPILASDKSLDTVLEWLGIPAEHTLL